MGDGYYGLYRGEFVIDVGVFYWCFVEYGVCKVFKLLVVKMIVSV